MTVTKDEFNGLGKRVTAVEVSMGEGHAKIERNAEDIQKLLTGLGKLPYWIMGSFFVPTALLVIQMIRTMPN